MSPLRWFLAGLAVPLLIEWAVTATARLSVTTRAGIEHESVRCWTALVVVEANPVGA